MDNAQPFDFRAFHARHRLAMIVACSENGVIGVDEDLPWRLPVDLWHFMRSTKGCSVIMGRKTFESLDRPVPDRLNIVVSRTMGDEGGGGAMEFVWRGVSGGGYCVAAADALDDVRNSRDQLTGQDYLGVEKRYYEPKNIGAEKILRQHLDEAPSRKQQRVDDQ